MKSKIFALDSNIFIYHFEQNPAYITYTVKIFKKIESARFHAVTSIISIIETLSYPISKDLEEQMIENFQTAPNLSIYNVNQEIAVESARIRREYKIRLPDSIQLATALYGKADKFITNDAKLQKFKDINVELLTDIT